MIFAPPIIAVNGLFGVVSTFCYTAVVTYIILKIIDATLGLRTSKDDEDYGLDVTQHNERGYDL